MFSVIRFYLFSKHRALYRAIAKEYRTSPLHVYRLAHGRPGRCNRDYYIIKRLKEHRIITTSTLL